MNEPASPAPPGGDLILYQTEDGRTQLQVRLSADGGAGHLEGAGLDGFGGPTAKVIGCRDASPTRSPGACATLQRMRPLTATRSLPPLTATLQPFSVQPSRYLWPKY